MVTITEERVAFRQRALAKHARTVAADAERLVRSHFGHLPPIKVVLTGDSNHLAKVASQAELDLVPGVPALNKVLGMRKARRNARGVYGVTVLTDPGVLIVVNLTKAATKKDVNEVLVHELTHGHQLGDPASREQQLAYMRHEFDVAKLRRREVRQIEALIERREVEARQAESLASRLPI